MKQNDTPTLQEVHEDLYDGADCRVTTRDGRTMAAKVRIIPRNEFSALAVVIGDDSEEAELAEAALYCARDIAFVKTLTEESLDLVLAEGHRLNFHSYARWFRRRARLVSLVQSKADLLQATQEALTRLERHDSTSGSSPTDTPTRPSGGTRAAS